MNRHSRNLIRGGGQLGANFGGEFLTNYEVNLEKNQEKFRGMDQEVGQVQKERYSKSGGIRAKF